MHDFKKIEKHFHEFLKKALNEKPSRIDGIELTGELFKQQEAFLIPLGFVSYFLGIENDKVVLYVRMATRMGVDFIVFIDEKGYDVHDVFGEYDEESCGRYLAHFKKVKRFADVKDLREFQK